jgi:hypothetical protein
VIEPVGLEDRTAEVLRLLEEQRASVLYVTGTSGVGKSTLGMRVGQVLAGQLREPFWAIDLCRAPPALPLAQYLAHMLGQASPGAAEGRGVLLLDNVDAGLAGSGLLSGGPGLWSTAVERGKPTTAPDSHCHAANWVEPGPELGSQPARIAHFTRLRTVGPDIRRGGPVPPRGQACWRTVERG